MKYLLYLFMLLPSLCVGQRVDYSYISDRRFGDPDDLLGYDFRPDAVEIPGKLEKEFSAGDYSFGITNRYLYVEGDDIRGVYNLNAINSTEYGFLLVTMNARDARLQGHLKVILNRYAEAEAVVFRRSPDDPEMIFFLPQLSKTRWDREQGYFTDRGEMEVPDPDSLWGKRVIPLMRIHHDQEGVQERLQGVDSTWVEFEEIITWEEDIKTKKLKDPEDLLKIEGDSIAINEDTTQVEIFNYTEIRTKVMTVRSILWFDDGGVEDTSETYTIKKLEELQNPNASPGEDRYEWIISFDEVKAEASLFFDHLRTVTRLDFNGKSYLVRGY
ncbi:MAG: DUF5309 domain-containing protein [Bacteroidetes bacterium]|nr:DUF5309 domain-containing protein [Bacteroidota bacterium]